MCTCSHVLDPTGQKHHWSRFKRRSSPVSSLQKISPQLEVILPVKVVWNSLRMILVCVSTDVWSLVISVLLMEPFCVIVRLRNGNPPFCMSQYKSNLSRSLWRVASQPFYIHVMFKDQSLCQGFSVIPPGGERCVTALHVIAQKHCPNG